MLELCASPAPPPGLAQNAERRPAAEICLEARLTSANPRALRAAVERWLGRHEVSPARLDGEPCEVRYSGDATFYLQPAGDGVSVFLHATGDDALRTVGWHSSDLLGALVGEGVEIAVTWVRHPDARKRNRIRFA